MARPRMRLVGGIPSGERMVLREPIYLAFVRQPERGRVAEPVKAVMIAATRVFPNARVATGLLLR